MKTALITGATAGIGQATTRLLVENGWRVIGTGRRQERLDALAQELGADRFLGLAFDITWLAAREEQMLDENLLSVGRRTALERAAFLIASLTMRAKAVGLNGNGAVGLPITQQLVADTLGLSLVHTNKTMRKLADRGLIRWRDRGCEVLDLERLREIAHSEFPEETKRPLV